MLHHPATDMEQLQLNLVDLQDLEKAFMISCLGLGPEDQIMKRKDQRTTGQNPILQMTKCPIMTFTFWDKLEILFFPFKTYCGSSFLTTFLKR
jgi:hypothetical protein